jgi:hypothetical protein
MMGVRSCLAAVVGAAAIGFVLGVPWNKAMGR